MLLLRGSAEQWRQIVASVKRAHHDGHPEAPLSFTSGLITRTIVMGPDGKSSFVDAAGELFESTLVKEEGKSGIRCTGGYDTDLGAVYVTRVNPDGPGTRAQPLPLERGDRILALNGKSLIDQSQKECYELIRTAPDIFTLTIQVWGLSSSAGRGLPGLQRTRWEGAVWCWPPHARLYPLASSALAMLS